MSTTPPSAKPLRESLLPDLQVGLMAVLPILLPLGVLLLQAMLWDLIAPYGWIAFLPAVALCGWVSGLRGGMLAALLSVAGAEWLLTLQPATASATPASRAFAALLFSALAAGVVIVFDQARRERVNLHRAITRLAGASLDTTRTPAGAWQTWRRGYADDLATLHDLAGEIEWRRQCLQAIDQPFAVFARGGRCLHANGAFLAAVGLEAESLATRNGLESGHFPGTGLAMALHRLFEQPRPGASGSVQLGAGVECRVVWCGGAEVGVAVCCSDIAPRPSLGAPLAGAAAAPLPAGMAAAAPVPAAPPAVVASAGAALAVAHQPGRRRTIDGLRCLVVDDQEINRSLLREILQLDGARVVACAGGREAIATLNADPDAFDVVLMDLQMPGMDGYAAARAIRSVADSAHLPIFAITADGPGVPGARLRDAGIQGLLHKPLEVERLLALLQEAQSARG